MGTNAIKTTSLQCGIPKSSGLQCYLSRELEAISDRRAWPRRYNLEGWMPVGDENQACVVCGGLRVAAVRAVDQLPHSRNPAHGGWQAEPLRAGPQDGGRQARFLRSLGAPE